MDGRMKPRAKQLGITDEDYALMLAAQGGVCAICGHPPKTRRLDTDHDHGSKEKRVRGLLCHRCNRALPSWMRSWWLRRAADYLDGQLEVGKVEREVHPSIVQMHREAAKVTPRRKDPAW